MCNFYIVIRAAYAGNVWCLVSVDLEKNENLLQSNLQVHVCHIYWDKFNPNNCLFIDSMPSGTLIGMEHPRMTLQIYSRSSEVSTPSLWSLWPLPVDFVGDIGDDTISWCWALLGVGAEMLSFGGWACPRWTSATLCNVWCTVIHHKFNKSIYRECIQIQKKLCGYPNKLGTDQYLADWVPWCRFVTNS